MTPAAFLTLFAENPKVKRAEPFLQKPEDWLVVGLMAGILLAAAVVFWLLEKWRKRTLDAPRQDMAEELTDFRGMYERGEITDEEYAKLRDKVATRVVTPRPPPSTGGAPGLPPGYVDLEEEGEEPPGPPAPPGPPGPSQSPPPPSPPP